MPWETFREKYKDNPFLKEHMHYPEEYRIMYLWDRIDAKDAGFQPVTFEKALKLLGSMRGDVLFMSENEDHPSCYGITVSGVEQKGCVAMADARELADLIEYEWNEGWRLSAQDMHLAKTVLPEDLYVFDESMDHVLVFTHEYEDWELETTEPMRCAVSRFCLMHGFS